MVIYLRKAVSTDLPNILQIISSAREHLFNNNIPQWQHGEGPTQQILEQDILQEHCYVLIVDQKIAGLGIISTDIERPYEEIRNGDWQQSNLSYATIHRVALGSDYQGKGLALVLINHLITTARLNNYLDIRIDTHPKNKAMLQIIKKAGFTYQGDILLPSSNGERVAYQLVLH